MSETLRAYLERRPEAAARGEQLGARLDHLVGAACAGLGGLAPDRVALARALATLEAPLEEIDEDAAAELALALACDAGDSRAIAELEARYGPAVEGALGAMKLAPALKAEVWQEVRRKLLVRDGGPIKLVACAGRGTLQGLLKVTATRVALTLVRDGARERPLDDASELEGLAGADAELDFVKIGARRAFRESFAIAIESLDPHARNLLRLHFLRKVTLEALATMYGVHRATIVRQLAAARAQVERETGKALRARLDLGKDEVEGVIDLVRSHFDASVERLLETRP
jgi:RNA polymerase sigma-70 factor (ECF subfamily)